jgi:hypothetical protein
MLRKIFGPKREEDEEGWRRLHNEGLHKMYGSPNITRVIKSRRVRWTGHAACMGEMRDAYKTLVRKPEQKRPLGRPRHRWEDNTRMNLGETGWEGVNWVYMAQGRDQWWDLVNMVTNLQVP